METTAGGERRDIEVFMLMNPTETQLQGVSAEYDQQLKRMILAMKNNSAEILPHTHPGIVKAVRTGNSRCLVCMNESVVTAL